MTFRVGQKVVCVDDKPFHENRGVPEIKSGVVYTIRWVGEAPYAPDRIFGPVVRLQEVMRGPNGHPEWNDYPFSARRFRPIVERKTDISFAHEILRKATKPARTPALSQHQRGTENV